MNALAQIAYADRLKAEHQFRRAKWAVLAKSPLVKPDLVVRRGAKRWRFAPAPYPMAVVTPFDFYAPCGAARVFELVSLRHGVTSRALKGHGRPSRLAHARQHLMYLLYSHFDMSFGAIGLMLGGRDHTTIRHGVLAHQARTGGLS